MNFFSHFDNFGNDGLRGTMKEVNVGSVTKESIKDMLTNLFDRNAETIIFRDPENRMSKEGWFQFLKTDCAFQHDARHFNFSNELSFADWWEISYQPDKATSYAYSNTFQPFHTDNAWFADPAAVNFFFMERQASAGGEQYLYPLDAIKRDLQEETPELYEKLTTIPVVIQKGNTDLRNETCIIDLEKDEIYWNYYRTQKNDPAVGSMCEEFFQWLDTKLDSPSVLTVRCNSGDGFAFNDLKVLHARNSFNATEPRERVLFQSMWKK